MTTGTGYILFDISFPPGQNDVGYAAGMQYTYNANGVVIKTSDGGDTWTTLLGGSGNTLDGIEAIAFTSADTGFIAGWNNYFAKTADGGTTWTTMTVGSGNWYFSDLDFRDSNNGIAMANLSAGGSAIYVTGDPTGPDTVCNNETSDYTSSGSDDADSYVWTLSPEDAGTVTGDGLSATVEWSSGFSGTATVGIAGVNDCGEGNPSTLDVETGTIPAPVINGENEVCDNTSEDYTTGQNEGSSYTWEIAGGTITGGQGTATVTVLWGGTRNGYFEYYRRNGSGMFGDIGRI